MAVERIREGEAAANVMASYGLCRTTAYKWLAKARDSGRGQRALATRKGSGRPPKLNAAQKRRVFRWIDGKNPLQYGFDFGLLTRAIVRELIVKKFEIRLSITSVGTLLAELNLTPQKPLNLVVDGLPAHKKKVVKDYVASTKGRLTLHFLPGYAPDLNPDELVWINVKRTGLARSPLQKGEHSEERVYGQLQAIADDPKLIRSFLKHPSVAHISDC